MIFNINGGGSAGLDFKVVCNPQPTNPNKNTIWVNTDEPITSWAFSATQPENAIEGMVWFFSAVFSHVEFNSLKKDTLQIYPIYARQYIGTEWVEKLVKSYQDDEWVDWSIIYLYKNGNTFDNLTGGYNTYGYTGDYGYSNIYLNETQIKIHVGGGTDCHATTIKPIDFTNISTLHFVIDSLTTTSEAAKLHFKVTDTPISTVLSNVGDGAEIAYTCPTNASGVKKTISLDVFNIKGRKYLSIGGRSTLRLAEIDAYISEIKGENIK